MGHVNASAICQFVVSQIIGEIANVHQYQDDIIGGANTIEELKEKHDLVTSRILDAGGEFKEDKSEFGVTEVLILGRRVCEKGHTVPQDAISRLSNLPAPATISQVRSYYAIFLWWARYILAMIAKPLSDLLKKGTKFNLLVSSHTMTNPKTH